MKAGRLGRMVWLIFIELPVTALRRLRRWLYLTREYNLLDFPFIHETRTSDVYVAVTATPAQNGAVQELTAPNLPLKRFVEDRNSAWWQNRVMAWRSTQARPERGERCLAFVTDKDWITITSWSSERILADEPFVAVHVPLNKRTVKMIVYSHNYPSLRTARRADFRKTSTQVNLTTLFGHHSMRVQSETIQLEDSIRRRCNKPAEHV
jgi:hypothetical protein